MKIKYSICALALITISVINCFPIEYSIDNPFKNVDVKINSQHYQVESIFSQNKNDQNPNHIKDIRQFLHQKERQSYFYDRGWSQQKKKSTKNGEAYCLDIQLKIKDPKTGCAINLTKRRFNPLQGDMPTSIYFYENFMLHGKSGRIAYTIDIASAYRNQKYIIESVNINILEASINGMTWPKNSSEKKLSEAFKKS